jgi:hypothetical protein
MQEHLSNLLWAIVTALVVLYIRCDLKRFSEWFAHAWHWFRTLLFPRARRDDLLGQLKSYFYEAWVAA